MAWITLLAPIVLELLKLFFAKDSTAEAKELAAEALLRKIKEVRAAVDAVPEKGTQDLEDIINGKKK